MSCLGTFMNITLPLLNAPLRVFHIVSQLNIQKEGQYLSFMLLVTGYMLSTPYYFDILLTLW